MRSRGLRCLIYIDVSGLCETDAPSRRRLKLCAGGLLAALLCLLTIALVRGGAGPSGGTASITYVGLTTTASGILSAQFVFSNGFPYPVQCAAAEAQVRLGQQWRPCSAYGYPNSPVFTVAPHGTHTFEIVVPGEEDAWWRVPLTYGRVATGLDRWNQVVRNAVGLGSGHPWFYTHSPEMFGGGNGPVRESRRK